MTPTAWNGPICNTCGAKYLNSHSCTWEDLERVIVRLRERQKRLTRSRGWVGLDDGAA